MLEYDLKIAQYIYNIYNIFIILLLKIPCIPNFKSRHRLIN